MKTWKIIFLIISITFGILGFSGYAGGLSPLCKIIFFMVSLFLVLSLIGLEEEEEDI
jgi:uncharacterized membrane protein YtjA (UPF0391 family)